MVRKAGKNGWGDFRIKEEKINENSFRSPSGNQKKVLVPCNLGGLFFLLVCFVAPIGAGRSFFCCFLLSAFSLVCWLVESKAARQDDVIDPLRCPDFRANAEEK